MADLWPIVWFSIWRPPPFWIWRDIKFASKTSYGTSFSVFVANLVRIRSRMAELLPFNWFLNGGPRHLGFWLMRILTVTQAEGSMFCAELAGVVTSCQSMHSRQTLTKTPPNLICKIMDWKISWHQILSTVLQGLLISVHSSSTEIGWVHLYLKIALPAFLIHFFVAWRAWSTVLRSTSSMTAFSSGASVTDSPDYL